jgi:hypothetical protein
VINSRHAEQTDLRVSADFVSVRQRRRGEPFSPTTVTSLRHLKRASSAPLPVSPHRSMNGRIIQDYGDSIQAQVLLGSWNDSRPTSRPSATYAIDSLANLGGDHGSHCRGSVLSSCVCLCVRRLVQATLVRNRRGPVWPSGE